MRDTEEGESVELVWGNPDALASCHDKVITLPRRGIKEMHCLGPGSDTCIALLAHNYILVLIGDTMHQRRPTCPLVVRSSEFIHSLKRLFALSRERHITGKTNFIFCRNIRYLHTYSYLWSV